MGALLVIAASVAGVMFQYGVRNVPVRYYLYRTVVVSQLLVCQHIRAMPMHVPVDTDNFLDHACDGADVMGHDYNGHALIQFMKKPVEFLFESVVDEIRRFIENQQFRVGNDSPT